MQDWQGKKVVIVGAARQGLALARYLSRHGARVVLNDRRPLAELQAEQQELHGLPVEWECGGHPLSLLAGADLLCISGGVPLDMPLVVEAKRRGLPLSNDSQIFLEAAPCRVVGITGSAGKTTTTTLVGRIARQVYPAGLLSAGRNLTNALECQPGVWVGGNIGNPLVDVLDVIQPDDLAVAELSSFQLELMTRSPQVAVVLNLTPNHLDRHGTMQAYAAAKAHILQNQSAQDVAVLGHDATGSLTFREAVRGRLVTYGLSEPPAGQEGTFLREGYLKLRSLDGGQPQDSLLMPQSAIHLRGEHNLRNALAALAAAVWALAMAGSGAVLYLNEGRLGMAATNNYELMLTWLFLSVILSRSLVLAVYANGLRARLGEGRLVIKRRERELFEVPSIIRRRDREVICFQKRPEIFIRQRARVEIRRRFLRRNRSRMIGCATGQKTQKDD